MGVSETNFTGIKTKAVDNVQGQVNKGSDMPQSIDLKDYYFHFLFASTSDT